MVDKETQRQAYLRGYDAGKREMQAELEAERKKSEMINSRLCQCYARMQIMYQYFPDHLRDSVPDWFDDKGIPKYTLSSAGGGE